MGKNKKSRRDERTEVMKLLFALSFRPDEEPEIILTDSDDIPSAYVENTFLGAAAFIPEADKLIETDSKNWKVTRLSPLTLSVLHLSVYEMLKTDVPPKVVINEAVEIAKIYDDEGAPGFINGILNRIAREQGVITPTERGDE